MNIISTSQNGQPVESGFRVDVSRGERIGRVSSEWFSRPDDERYLSLTELYDAVKARADRATARTVESRAVRVEASREDAERVHHRLYATRAEARRDLFGYIEGFYNPRRLHSALGYISPAEMERRAA